MNKLLIVSGLLIALSGCDIPVNEPASAIDKKPYPVGTCFTFKEDIINHPLKSGGFWKDRYTFRIYVDINLLNPVPCKD